MRLAGGPELPDSTGQFYDSAGERDASEGRRERSRPIEQAIRRDQPQPAGTWTSRTMCHLFTGSELPPLTAASIFRRSDPIVGG